MKTRYSCKKRIKAFLKTLRFLLPIAIGNAFCLESCKKFVDVPPPQTQIVTATVFNNNGAATSAQLAIYVQMYQNAESYGMALNMGEYADELKNYTTTNTNQIQVYTNALLPVKGYGGTGGTGIWGDYYNYIYQANAVISGLQSTSGTTAAVKQQLTGEAYFTRAFFHFYLTNIYGDVPIVLSTNYVINNRLARSPRVQVLQQVIADLRTAESLLNPHYVDAATDTAVTTERVRPNKAVAQAMLARAYLYLADYDASGSASWFAKAKSEADTVISNSSYALSTLNGVFLANSSEAIWQLQTPQPPPPSDTPDGAYFILLGAPSSTNSTTNTSALSDQLMSSFEPNDQRVTNWIGSITEGTTTYYFPYKYKNYTYVGTEYDMVLRLGEQYLIRAEAEANGAGGGTGAAITDLDMIRNRAGLPNYSSAVNGPLLTAILHERQVELFTEWGARWFDLCRTKTNGTSNAALVMGSPGNVCQAKGGSWSPNNYQLFWPIPQGDISTDPNLTQNPQY